MAKPVAEAERDEMVDLLKAGRSIAEIAEDLGRGQQAVRDHLAAAGLISRQPPTGVSDDQIKALVASYVEEQLSIRECADDMDLPPSTVRNALLYAGVRLRPQGGQR